jgi:hypothetical protein
VLILRRSQPLLTQKKSTKIEWVPIGKSSWKHHSKVTRGFGRDDSPCWKKKKSVPNGKSSLKHLPKVMREFESARSPCWQRKSQQNNFWRWCVDSSTPPALVDPEIVNENRVAADSEIITESASKDDAWIRKRSKALLIQKRSTKQLPKVTHGFVSAHNPSWLRNSKRKLSRLLKNYHRNTFQRRRVDSKELPVPVDWEKVNENGVGADLEIITETSFKGDAWIQKRLQPLLT